MEQNLLLYSGIALVISIITQFLIIDLSHRKGIFIDDHESDLPQKLHSQPTPRIGGLGIFLGLICLLADIDFGRWILIATVPTFIAGFLEDLFTNISPAKRLLIMSISTVSIIALPVHAYVTDFGFFTAPAVVGIIITIVAILGMINGTNLIDGFNGLSSGISLIILATFTITALKVGDKSIATVGAVTFAALLGFYVFNYPKGRIFLGDGGAYVIGFLLAVIAILIVKNNPQKVSPFFALLCLVYPAWEVIYSFTRRLLKGKSPLQPDSDHFHQLVFRTVARGINSRTCLYIYPIVLLFCGLAVLFCQNTTVLAAAVGAFVVVYVILYKSLKRRDNH